MSGFLYGVSFATILTWEGKIFDLFEQIFKYWLTVTLFIVVKSKLKEKIEYRKSAKKRIKKYLMPIFCFKTDYKSFKFIYLCSIDIITVSIRNGSTQYFYVIWIKQNAHDYLMLCKRQSLSLGVPIFLSVIKINKFSLNSFPR